MSLRCLLWDFGDTLYDERSIWDATPAWGALYETFDVAGGLGELWCRGEISDAIALERIAASVGWSRHAVHARFLDPSVYRPFHASLAFFHARNLPQAIVTVNPPLFRDIAQALGLTKSAPTLVISGEEGTSDKGVLCATALERLGLDLLPGETVLIDNRDDNLEAWKRRGGVGYLHRGDCAFAQDLVAGVHTLGRQEIPPPEEA
ncbi:MAG: hypothetical protein H6806_10655 [Planctomycetes bacterium]|nr:hypothetical protein [Planctomycetota bacterium]MCB9824216.1 hypothetical protein [Planctomycetota bacterium]MCB9830207.1 hypothetical protein [Planctomycetota bacterium]